MELKEHHARDIVDGMPYIGEYFQPDDRVYYKKDVDSLISTLKSENAALKAQLADTKYDLECAKVEVHESEQAYFEMQEREQSIRSQLSELQEAVKKELIMMYNQGYHAGHHDTVEGGYVDILVVDMPTYHSDVVDEILEDSALRALLTKKE